MSGYVKDIDHGWKKVKAEILKLRSKSVVAVGVQGQEAAAEREGGITNGELAAVHEYGAPSVGIPERSYLRATVDAKGPAYMKLIETGLGRVLDGDMASEAVLALLGERVVADVKNRIKAGIAPELKPETVRRKDSSKQLVDTGQLLNSITYKVEEK